MIDRTKIPNNKILNVSTGIITLKGLNYLKTLKIVFQMQVSHMTAAITEECSDNFPIHTDIFFGKC